MANGKKPIESKICIVCSAVFYRKRTNGTVRWKRQRCCSHACAAHGRRRLEQDRPCASCGKAFAPARADSKYCSAACVGAAKRAKHSTHARYKKITTPDGRRMLEHRYVMEVKLGRPLKPFEQVHHKNGDKRSNEADNLELWVRAQPGGQRVSDLVAFVVENYRELVGRFLLGGSA